MRNSVSANPGLKVEAFEWPLDPTPKRVWASPYLDYAYRMKQAARLCIIWMNILP